MTAKQSVWEAWNRLREKPLSRPVDWSAALRQGMEAGIRMLLSAVISSVSVFGGQAPFGVAMAAAGGPGICGAASVLGACFGYLCQMELSQGLRYSAAAILVFAVAFAFYDVKRMQEGWLMPAVGAVMIAFTGMVTRSGLSWSGQAEIAFCAEIALCAVGTWCYRWTFAPKEEQRKKAVGTLFSLTTILMALEPLKLGNVSLGSVLAAAAVLTVAYTGDAAESAVTGMMLGMGIDLSRGDGAVCCAVWGLGGALCASGLGGRRWMGAICFGLSGVFAALWVEQPSQLLGILEEGVLGAALFCMLPPAWLGQKGMRLMENTSVGEELGAVRLACGRLQAASKAFRTLYDSMYTAFVPPQNDNDVAMVFDRTAGRVCRGCSLWNVCWQKGYSDTFNALNDATAAMVERGRAEGKDFPSFFVNRCIKWKIFLETVNEELTALAYRRQYQAKVRENRAAVCRQYDQLSELLGQTASELSQELTFDRAADRKIRDWMKRLGIGARTGVFRDGRGLLHLRAEGADCVLLERPSRMRELGNLLGVPVRLEYREKESLSLVQQEPLMAVAGIAARRKDGETVSGDAGTYFKCPDGMVYVLLCDGMGSGEAANRESSLAVRLLEQFLQAGVGARQALGTLSSALALRGEETGGFTTVDLLGIDLFTGESVLYKLGAAPSYVRQGESVRRIAGESLPAGLSEGTQPAMDEFPLHLAPGDWVVMISDGICGTQDDSWIMEELSGAGENSPKELACVLLSRSAQGATDDRTALVVRVERRK